MPSLANRTFRTAIFAASLLACLPAAFCQTKNNFVGFNPRFEVFTLPGGVLGNSVQAIVQDSAGFLWFASQEGLHRYDGQRFFTYRNDPLDSNSLANDYCEYVFLDSKGVLWLAHWNAGGLTAFDPTTETFTRYFHDPEDPETLSGNTTGIIAEDRQGFIWVGGESGLDRLDRKTGKSKRFHHDPADSRSLSYNHVRGLYVDKQGTLWVGTGFTWDFADPQRKRGGLNRYDPKTESFTRYLHDPKNPNSLAHNQVRALLEDSQGNFWVGTGGDGLHLMNREKGTFTRLTYDSRTTGTGSANSDKLSIPRLRRATFAAQLRESHVSSIFEDGQGRIWITAVQGGLNVFDPKSGAVRHFETGSGEGSLTTNFLWQTFQSADGTIWIATGNGGATIFKIGKQGKRIPFFLPTHSNPGAGTTDAIKDKAGNVWIGYGNNPTALLIRYDRKTGKEFPIPGSNPAPDGLNARIVNTLMPDREGFLWVGTENGLFQLDPLTGKFRHFTYPPGESTWVGNLHQDRNGYIWTYHWRNGLNRLDLRTGKFICYRHDPADPGSIGGNLVSGLWEDAEGALWVGGGSRNDLNFPFFLDRFNPPVLGAADAGGQNLFTHFIKEKEAGTAEYLTGDDRGKLWFLAFGGIQKFDPVTGDRQKFSPANSNLLSRSLTALAKAKDGRFWLNADDGFIYELDPETAQFHAYGKQHGIPKTSQDFSEIHVADDGEVLIGRAGGFIAFYPDSLRQEENNRPPDVRITDFHLFDERVAPGSLPVLKKPIWQTTALRLAHDQNVFSFSVACFDFADPDFNQLQFMLDGYDKRGWRKDLRDGETPSYVNVPPGDYTFRVRGSNSLGIWNMEGVSMKIKILQPWWKRWWAYVIYGLLFLAATVLFDRNQRRRIIQKERHRILQRELEQAKEIEKAYAELKATQNQLIQKEKLASLGELTAGIAHEIQNPLNFVNNFSELSVDLAQELNEEIEKELVDKALVKELIGDLTSNQEKINHHGKRASSIVTGMLQHARTSTGKKEPTDLNALADEYLRLSYHGLRAKDSTFNAKMVTDFDPAVGKVEVVPQDIGRVFLNLLNNAFYATQQRQKLEIEKLEIPYEPTVSVSSKKTAGGVEFRFRDNGTGIPEAVKAKIFQPFFTTKPTGQGTGLGLSLAYDIVTKGHGGTLEVDAKEDEGTEFVVRLPSVS